MTETVLISICIPAYKNIEFLSRLMDSIAAQTFKDFEVVLTDDSPGQDVKELCDRYAARFHLRYFRNQRQLGTPENWNEAVRRSSGEWIKIMHDDDWFSDPGSLDAYVRAIGDNPGAGFIFSAYRDIFLDENRVRKMFLPRRRYKAMLRNPTVLFAQNIIGPPSVVMYRRSLAISFDPAIKWVVDIDFYIRCLFITRPVHIPELLINVGLGKSQVTRDCFREREVEIPENFYLLQKVGYRQMKNIFVYDSWWRLIRNLEVRRKEDISGSGYKGPIPKVILSMVRWQRLLPLRWWRAGSISKTGMFLHYLVNYHKIPA
jgi:glycosyltransferase involved in cell wall biosynthesis